MSSGREPIHIAGAGPAGLAAALTLSAAGIPAVVHERAPRVGHRFHGDLQGLENWTTDGDVLEELAALGIAPAFEHAPVHELVVFDPRDRAHVVRSGRPLFYLVRRGAEPGSLDAGLAAAALARGVEIRFDDAWRDPAGRGVMASGPRTGYAIVVGYVFDTDAADGAYAALAERLAPAGYAYLMVLAGRATIAACLFDGFSRRREYLGRTVAYFRERLGFGMRRPHRFGGTGNVWLPRSARRGGLLLAGEAAGFQDALWGFGIRYALLSGSLAATALARGVPHRYDAWWRRRLGGLLRTGVVNRYIYGLLGDRGYMGLLRLIERAPDARDWLGRQYRPSLAKRLLLPLARRAVTRRREAADRHLARIRNRGRAGP